MAMDAAIPTAKIISTRLSKGIRLSDFHWFHLKRKIALNEIFWVVCLEDLLVDRTTNTLHEYRN